MRIASLPLEIEAQRPAARRWFSLPELQLLGLVLLLSGQYGSLPQANCQGSSAGKETDSAEKSNSADNKCEESSGKVATGTASVGRHGFNKPYGYYLNPILDYVRANKEQRVRIAAIVESFRGRIQPLSEEYRNSNREFLAHVAHCEHPEALMNEQRDLGYLYSDITLSYCQMSLEVRKVLSPQQIVLYEQFKRKQGWGRYRRPVAPAK